MAYNNDPKQEAPVPKRLARHSKYEVLVGDRFNDWQVTGAAEAPPRGPKKWPCVCVCGETRKVNHFNLVQGKSTGCGCTKDRKTAGRNATHALSNTRAYVSWCAMWTRCTNPNQRSHARYKDRCPPVEWKDFSVFYAEMGDCPPGLSLDRVCNSKPYGPGNCRWASMMEQGQNKSNTIRVVVNDRVMSLRAACRGLGITYVTAAQRVREQGWSVERALSYRARPFLEDIKDA